jgi:uncharacterized protein (DUF1330 family)
MVAYMLVDIDIHDPVGYEEYRRLATPTVHQYGGRYIVRGGRTEVIEGTRIPARVVVLEFPSPDQARAWWDSPEYRPLRAIRQRTATTSMILVEGV